MRAVAFEEAVRSSRGEVLADLGLWKLAPGRAAVPVLELLEWSTWEGLAAVLDELEQLKARPVRWSVHA